MELITSKLVTEINTKQALDDLYEFILVAFISYRRQTYQANHGKRNMQIYKEKIYILP